MTHAVHDPTDRGYQFIRHPKGRLPIDGRLRAHAPTVARGGSLNCTITGR